MQLAISRPKNLQDVLTKAATKLPHGTNINQIIEQLRKP